MTASEIVKKYIAFFEKNGHKRIANSPLVPLNDPTTLFTSSGMQPLVPYLLGETHPLGTRLVNVQNVFRANDIDEIGDNRHTTFFRMLGNWSLGDYFKKEEIPWLYTFLTKELKLPPEKLYVTIFKGTSDVPRDDDAEALWIALFKKSGIEPKGRIFEYDAQKNWWSRSGPPENMPAGEPGGPDTEVFYDFGSELKLHETSAFKASPCHVNCDCGRYIEIANSVFMQYTKTQVGKLVPLPKPNVDFGGGLERLLIASENQPDVFQTSLLAPIIDNIAAQTSKNYRENELSMRIITDHLTAASFIIMANISPSNTDQGYILRRLIRRAYDHFSKLEGKDVSPILEAIAQQYKDTDLDIVTKHETIKNTILEEISKYGTALNKAKAYIMKKYKPVGDELMGVTEISPVDVFYLYSSHGLSPTQIESIGYIFDKQKFAQMMDAHQNLSKQGAGQKFRGGLADHQERTVMGHTATHLMHQALRDILGDHVHQTGSNITTARVRFDFNYDQKLTDEQITKIESIVNEKIKANLPVHFEMLATDDAKKLGAIGLFDDTYEKTSKIYFIGGDSSNPKGAYSIEFCGGPHVDFTGRLKSFKIIKQENIGNKQRRIYALTGE